MAKQACSACPIQRSIFPFNFLFYPAWQTTCPVDFHAEVTHGNQQLALYVHLLVVQACERLKRRVHGFSVFVAQYISTFARAAGHLVHALSGSSVYHLGADTGLVGVRHLAAKFAAVDLGPGGCCQQHQEYACADYGWPNEQSRLGWAACECLRRHQSFLVPSLPVYGFTLPLWLQLLVLELSGLVA